MKSTSALALAAFATLQFQLQSAAGDTRQDFVLLNNRILEHKASGKCTNFF